MKILQAIVTSASETLDGRQGFGLVRCSRMLPPLIRQEASDLGYSSDAGGKAIYSLKSCPVAESLWLIMNRTVPDVDYTGRTSHISHTIAVREDELRAFLLSINEGVASVFEFMVGFEWKSSWEGDPTWIEETEDLEASSIEGFRSSMGSTAAPLDPHGLLCFDYSETDSPKPKRAAWSFGGASPEEMLETFQRAWLCLDPWRGSRKHGDILGEPHVTLRDSWACSFTTNLRHGRPDFYQWVALSAESPTIPNRDVVDPRAWSEISPDLVKERIDSELGRLLVDRCVQGAEAWADEGLVDKLKELEKDYEENAKNLNEDAYDEIQSLINGFRSSVEAVKQEISDFERQRYWAYSDEADKEISELRAKLSMRQMSAHQNIENIRSEYETNAIEIRNLLSPSLLEKAGMETSATNGFPSLTKDFEALAQSFRDYSRIAQTCRNYKDFHVQHDGIKIKYNEKDLELANAINKNIAYEHEINGLKRVQSALEAPKSSLASAGKRKIKSSGNKPTQAGWQIVVLSILALSILLISAWYIMSGRGNKNKKYDTNRITQSQNPETNLIATKSEVEGLNDQIKRLEMENADLAKANERLKKANTLDSGGSVPRPNPEENSIPNGRPNPPSSQAVNPIDNNATQSGSEPAAVVPPSPRNEGDTQKARDSGTSAPASEPPSGIVEPQPDDKEAKPKITPKEKP
jgi:hypothetical protein